MTAESRPATTLSLHRKAGSSRVIASMFKTIWNALWNFLAHDGWAIASHIALSLLIALFPFLIVLTAIASLVGSADLADEAARLLLETWPPEVAGPLAGEIRAVLTGARGNALTIGSLLGLYFASSGVEALRIGLNRAYAEVEERNFLLLRLESIGFVMVGAIAILTLAFGIVLGPLIVRTISALLPEAGPLLNQLGYLRFAVATATLAVALLCIHLWLPAGKRRLRDVWPGIVLTMLLWLAGGVGFGRYLDDFGQSYSKTYAGLAAVMIALAFLYLSAAIFLLGAELNAALAQRRAEKARAEQERREKEQALASP